MFWNQESIHTTYYQGYVQMNKCYSKNIPRFATENIDLSRKNMFLKR